MDNSKITLNHTKIQEWIDSHNGKPAKIRDVGEGVDGILRVKFTFDDKLEEISYDEFFKIFEDNNLAFLYEDEVTSTFNKFISRDSVTSNHFKEKQKGEKSKGEIVGEVERIDLVYIETSVE